MFREQPALTSRPSAPPKPLSGFASGGISPSCTANSATPKVRRTAGGNSGRSRRLDPTQTSCFGSSSSWDPNYTFICIIAKSLASILVTLWGTMYYRLSYTLTGDATLALRLRLWRFFGPFFRVDFNRALPSQWAAPAEGDRSP